MNEIFQIVALAALLGSLIGFIMALSGAGGGITAVPALVFGLGLPVAAAAPVGLLAVGLAAALGAGLGLRQGIVRYRAAVFIGLCGMLMAPLGVWLAGRLPNPPLLLAFAAVLAYTASRTLLRRGEESEVGRQPCQVSPGDGRLMWTAPCARALAGTGLLSGFLSGLLGVGGGFVIVPALQRHSDIPRDSIVATSLGVMSLVAASGVISALLHGRLEWSIALPFTAGALIGLLAGRRVASRLSGQRLNQGFALVCLLAAALLVWRAAGQAA